MVLPISVRPFEDELFYGYVLRLAHLNHCDVKTFDRFFLRSHADRSTALRMDYPTNLDWAYQHLRSTEFFPNPETIILWMTPARINAMRMTMPQQCRFISAILMRQDDPLVPQLAESEFRELRYCPVCMKEIPYIRTWHMLPGVKTCAKHNVALRTISRNRGVRYSWGKVLMADLDDPVSETSGYAAFMRALYDRGIITNLNIIESVLKKSTNSIGLVKDKEQFFEKLYEVLKVENISLLMDASNVPMVKPMYCLKCNAEFYIHPGALGKGFGCPECGKRESPTDQIQNHLKKVGDGAYMLKGEFKGYSSTEVLHKTCGKVRRNLKKAFWEDQRCKCESSRQIPKIQERIDKVIVGYQVIGTMKTESAGVKLLIRHKKCGNIFPIKEKYFLESPGCRICDAAYNSVKRFLRTVRRLTGGEYELVGEYKELRTPVKMKHTKCGTSFTILPSSFLGGCRCPLCTPKYSVQYVKASVNSCTGGRFSAEFAGKYYCIYHYKKAIGYYSPQEIMQELNIPAPGRSKLFGKLMTVPVQYTRRACDLFLKMRVKIKKSGSWQISDGAEGYNFRYSKDRGLLQWLANNKYIERTGRGVYTLAQDADGVSIHLK